MRLIDADKIHWEFKCISKEEIDDEPTVKAISIEWLKKYAKKKEKLYIPYSTVIMRILEDWEAESGADK